MNVYRCACAVIVALAFVPFAEAQPAPAQFSVIDIEKPAPLVEFKDSRLARISGGVEITLRSGDENVKPMRLAAQEIAFAYPETGGSSPSAIELQDKVSVDSPQGLISSDRAQLDLKGGLLTFTGNVTGKSEDIDEFQADKIVYNLETGDSEMVNLRARGIGLGGASDNKSSSATDFSEMNIDRAAAVKFSEGQVQSMSGGVAITLAPSDAKAKALKLSASTVGFTWSAAGKPSGIKMRSNVRVDGPQGDIKSDSADLDLAKKQLDFTGNVKGSSDQIQSFDTEKLAYNLDTGETQMTNLKAQGLSLGAPGPEKPEDAPNPFSRMDIDQAPEVSMTSGKLNWIRGGVNIRLLPEKKEEEPLVLRAREFTFSYPENAASPGRVILKDDVSVDGRTTDIKSDNADLNLAENELTFTGNVKGNMPGFTGATAQRFIYDLRTGNLKMDGARVEELNQHSLAEPAAEKQ